MINYVNISLVCFFPGLLSTPGPSMQTLCSSQTGKHLGIQGRSLPPAHAGPKLGGPFLQILRRHSKILMHYDAWYCTMQTC